MLLESTDLKFFRVSHQRFVGIRALYLLEQAVGPDDVDLKAVRGARTRLQPRLQIIEVGIDAADSFAILKGSRRERHTTLHSRWLIRTNLCPDVLGFLISLATVLLHNSPCIAHFVRAPRRLYGNRRY